MDPDECDHGSITAADSIDDEGDTIYVSGTCDECGASASAVYPLTHYLVFDDEGDPTEVPA